MIALENAVHFWKSEAGSREALTFGRELPAHLQNA